MIDQLPVIDMRRHYIYRRNQGWRTGYSNACPALKPRANGG